MGYQSDYDFGVGVDNGTQLTLAADPFATYSNAIYPRTVKEVFEWAEWMWTRNGLYTQAIRKSTRYFFNDIQVEGKVSYDIRRKYEKFYKEDLHILALAADICDEYIAFGNTCTSIHIPIMRSLMCPECFSSRPLKNMVPEKEYHFRDYKFHGDCPACGAREVTYKIMDVRRPSENNPVKVIRWNPRHLIIDFCNITGEAEYYYKIPPDDRRKIEAGDHLYLSTVPWEIVEAVRDQKLLHFNKDTFFHMKVGIIPSMNDRTKGWGLPMFMSNFAQMVQLQMLERFNEAMAMDYIVPCRMLTPTMSGQVGDPMRLHNSSTMVQALKGMVAEHRRDPTTWHIMPYPVQYTRIGGDAKQMVPVELIDRALDNLLTSMGIPQEFYRGTLNMGNGAPIGLRMFEKTWSHHTNNMNAWLRWFTNQVAKIMMWEDVSVSLVMTSIQEDEMGKQVKLNLASAGVISKYTALKSFGINPYDEIDRRIDEQRYEENKIREIQAESSNANMVADAMAQATIPLNAAAPNMGGPLPAPAGQGGAPAGGGGAPPPPMGGPPTLGGSPAIDDLMQQSQSMAQQIMTMDPATRRSQLTQLKSQNPTLHAQVKQMIKDMEQQAGQQGVQQARGQGGQ